jgi:hypothetical protein
VTDPRCRRAFLRGSVVGLAALGGCLDDGLLSGGRERDLPELDGAALAEVVDGEAPAVPDTAPVGISAGHLDRAASRTRRAVESVPSSLSATEIPNEAIREEIRDARTHAVEALDAAEAAPSRLAAMGDLRRARRHGADAAAAWGVVEGELTRSAVESRLPVARDRVSSFRERWRYVGADPVRAVRLFGIVEELSHDAARQIDPENPLLADGLDGAPVVGDLAGEIETAAAAVDDASHLYDRHRASVDAPRDLRPSVEAAIGSLSAILADRYGSFPDDVDRPETLVDRDVSDLPAAELLEWAYHRAEGGPADVERRRSNGRLAGAVLRAHVSLANFRAFERVRRRVAEGEDFAVGSVDDVAALRTEAIETVESTLPGTRGLTTDRLVELVEWLRGIGDRLRDLGADPIAPRVGDEAVPYVLVASTARSVPAATETVVAALSSAAD